ncbi:MAG: helix-turn-helix domain-containing protein [Vicinamibacterales bacterium]
MEYREFVPSQSLRAHVASYWRFALPETATPIVIDHVVPPDGTVNIVWLPGERAVLLGPRVSALHVPVRSGEEYLGVRFLPGVAGAMLNVDVRTLRDTVTPLARPEFDAVARARGIAGFDDELMGWLREASAPDPVVVDLVTRITRARGSIGVHAITEAAGVGYRQALRRFQAATGLTFKEYARIRRIRAACVDALQSRDPSWADLSLEAGFADQAHLTREFRDVFGWPTRLVHEYLRRIEHRHVSE